MIRKFGLLFTLLFLAATQLSFSQNRAEKDSLFRLLDASSAQQLEESGMDFRRVLGPGARFFHNNTYLICDSASWNVTLKFIEAYGNVKIIQDNTMLMSESMLYMIDQSTAKFQGEVVELLDKSGNKLRTKQLDYNTKDSVASFKYGGAMKDTSGNVIESKRGTYDSKLSSFTFMEKVEMYNDSIFIKTDTLNYHTDIERADFGKNTYMWRGTGFMNANAGWYDTRKDIVYFTDNPYMNDEEYEAWGDEVYYKKGQGILEMYKNVQILDTANTTILLANTAKYYMDSLLALLTDDPAVIYYGENENHEPDSVFIRADSLYCYSVEKWTIPKKEVDEAKTRKDNALFDALAEIRAKQAEARAKAAQDKLRELGKLPPVVPADSLRANADSSGTSADSLGAKIDSLGTPADSLRANADSSGTSADSLGAKIDSLGTPTDSLGAKIDSSGTSADSLGAKIDSLGTSAAPLGVKKDPLEVLKEHATDSLTPTRLKNDSIPTNKDTNSSSEENQFSAKNQLSSNKKGDKDSLLASVDSLSMLSDTTAINDTTHRIDRSKLDTTLVRHLKAYYNVKLYRSDLQAVCDSMIFTELDSMARLFSKPALWNQVKNQLTSEEMQLLIKDGEIYRGSMLNAAMITTKEDSIHFNQIKSTEMVGFFSDNKLNRYDALGGVTAVYYMVEDEHITTINVKEAKSMTAVIKDGNAQKMLYLEEVKSDAYPLAELAKEKQKLKGFEWRGSERPTDRNAITKRSIYQTQRDKYTNIIKPRYIYTNIYFENYMDTVYKRIEEKAALERERQIDSVKRATLLEIEAQNRIKDSLSLIQDSLSVIGDSLTINSDSLNIVSAQQQNNTPNDSLIFNKTNVNLVDSTKYNQGVDVEKDNVAEQQPLVKPHKLTCKEKRMIRKAKRAHRRQMRALLKEKRALLRNIRRK